MGLESIECLSVLFVSSLAGQSSFSAPQAFKALR